jgi:hypothetical protein
MLAVPRSAIPLMWGSLECANLVPNRIGKNLFANHSHFSPFPFFLLTLRLLLQAAKVLRKKKNEDTLASLLGEEWQSHAKAQRRKEKSFVFGNQSGVCCLREDDSFLSLFSLRLCVFA